MLTAFVIWINARPKALQRVSRIKAIRDNVDGNRGKASANDDIATLPANEDTKFAVGTARDHVAAFPSGRVNATPSSRTFSSASTWADSRAMA